MRTPPPLLAILLFAAGCPEAAKPPALTAAPLPHAWPPRVGEPLPDLQLLDDAGATVALSALRGKVLIVQPVALSSQACQAYSGGKAKGGFRGVTPQPDLLSLDETLRAVGLDPAHPDLALVQLLFFDLEQRAPGVGDARAWTAHFGLAERASTHVLLGDERYAAHPATAAMIPGLFLVDRDGTVVANATRAATAEERAELIPALQRLLAPPPPVEERPPARRREEPVEDPPATTTKKEEPPARKEPAPPKPRTGQWGLPDPSSTPEAELIREAQEAAALLSGGRWAELDARFAAARRAGRRKDRYVTQVELLADWVQVGSFEEQRERLDAWVAAAPRSPWARATRADFHVAWAWDARGSGYANTVTEEGWRLFGERLRQAAADIEAALELDPKNEVALVVRMTVATGLGVEPEVAARWFQPIESFDPPLFGAWNRYLNYLMPKWHGDEEGKEMWALARRAVKEHPDEPAFHVLTVFAHDETERTQPGWLKAHVGEVRAAIEAATRGYPRSARVWSAVCWTAKRAGEGALFRQGLERAADLGDEESMEWLASRLKKGSDGFVRDPARARGYVWRAAHIGSSASQAEVGQWFLAGEGVPQDPAEGVRWLEKSAGNGDAEGQVTLALCYENGVGVPRDPALALEWYRRASASDKRKVQELAAQRIAGLERAARAKETRPHPDGFEDWYPQDVTPPAGTRYPGPLTGLPRDLGGIPAGDRRWVNHACALLLRAIHARLWVWHNLDLQEALERYEQETAEARAAFAAEPIPPGLEPFRDDVLAALDAQVAFHEKVVAGVQAELPRLRALAEGERERRFQVVLGRLVESIPEGKQASGRLRAAWAKLEARWGRTWKSAVKDSLFQHLAALDVF